MTMFFMHHVNDGERFDDVEGYDRAGLNEMRAEAFLAARELMAAQIRKGRRPDFDAYFDITNQAGDILARVHFIDTLDRTSPQAPASALSTRV
ncbi:MAG: hypothetical protein K2Y29_08405 [Beijerinckiaceae bacterium]|nr:hypothetical protein [Beijerinckiaceae bacterium]